MVINIVGGLALFAAGLLIGGTAAWYKAWDEGFREGYDRESRECADRRKKFVSSPMDRNLHDDDLRARKAS